MMRSLHWLMAIGLWGGASAHADRLCDAARNSVEQLASAKGWQVDVRCRATGGATVSSEAVLQAAMPAQEAPLRSGPITWAIRVQTPNAVAFVQRVPLTVTWLAPTWVSRHDLAVGASLQAEDLEIQVRRWPDGLVISPAQADFPLTGRMRRAVRAGDIVTTAQLLPVDSMVRGDRVTAVLAEGAMEIRIPAQLLAPARVGERVRIQVHERPTALEGRLADARTVMVDSE